VSGLAEVWQLGRRLLVRTRDQHLVDMAAKIAFYSFLSLFPVILVLFALAGILGGDAAFEWTMLQLRSIMPREAAEWVGTFVYDVTSVQRPDVLSGSLVFLLFSAAGAVVSLIESFNVIFEIGESRPLWRKYLLAMGTVVLGAAFYLVGLPAILAGPALFPGLGFDQIWSRLHWPLVFSLLTAIVWLAYWRLPNHRRPPPQLILLVGALVATGLWALVTLGLQLYVANFERFASVYGVVTGILVTLIWFQMSAFTILFGAQVAAALAAGARGHRP
jgi:membrane protein